MRSLSRRRPLRRIGGRIAAGETLVRGLVDPVPLFRRITHCSWTSWPDRSFLLAGHCGRLGGRLALVQLTFHMPLHDEITFVLMTRFRFLCPRLRDRHLGAVRSAATNWDMAQLQFAQQKPKLDLSSAGLGELPAESARLPPPHRVAL